MADQTDPPQPQPPAEGGEAQRSSLVDTLAEAQALAALDELIAKVDSVEEANGGAAAQAHPEPPPEAYALTGDAPPFDGWYVAMRDNAHGPLTVEDLKDRWSRGEIGADTLCWREGMSEWRALSRLHALTTAIVPRPREGLKALSSKPPVRSQPASFAPSASKMLKSLAEQEREVQTDRLVGAVAVPASPAASPAPAEARPPTSPTTPEGPKRVPAPAVKPPVFSAERPSEDEDEEAPRRAAGVSGARLFASLFAASVLGGVVGGYVVKVTMPAPPPPAPVVTHEPIPPAPPPVAPPTAQPAPSRPAPAVQPSTPPAPPARVEMPPAKVEAKPKPAAKPPAEGEGEGEEVTAKPPKKPATPPPPKTQLDKDFQDTFGQ